MNKNKRDILIITERFYPEEFIINGLAKEWCDRGYEVTVLTQVPSYPFGKVYKGYKNLFLKIYYWNKIKIYRFYTVQGYKRSLLLKILNYFNFAIIGSIISLFIGYRYDKIFVYQTGPLTLSIPAIVLKKVYKKEVAIWTQDLWPDSVYAYGFRKTWILTFFLDLLVRIIYKNCDNIFVSCHGFIERIKKYVDTNAIYYFPNWPISDFRKDKERKNNIKLSDKFNFTFAGNIGKVQNLEKVIMGFALVSANNDRVQLNIIGDGSNLEYLKGMVANENIKNVVFWGRKKLDDMPYYLNASDVLIISLKDEPLFELTVPSKFQAYLTAEKPIFAIIKGEVKKIVEEYKLGITADPNSIEDIKKGFIKFYQMSNDGIKKLSTNSKKLLENVFDSNRIIDAMTNIFIS